ncbi:hypothetical protein [Archaeoglobus sp.]
MIGLADWFGDVEGVNMMEMGNSVKCKAGGEIAMWQRTAHEES